MNYLVAYVLLLTAFAQAQAQSLDEYGRPTAAATPTPVKEITQATTFEKLPNNLQTFLFTSLPLSPVKDVILPAKTEVTFQLPGEFNKLEDIIVTNINSAKLEVLFNSRAITSQRIAQALVQAKLNGKTVVGILDEKPEGISRYNAPSYFTINNLPIFFDSAESDNSNNYLLIDRKKLIITSFDWTRSSNVSTSGNIFSIEDPGIAIAYYNGWINQLRQSTVPPKTQAILNTLTK